jgi:hypothetical protein
MATISGILAYVKLQQPDFKFGSTTEKEFSVNLIITKAEAKVWNKEFPKQKAREVDRSDFEKAYKIEPPTDDDEFYVLAIRKPAQYKDLTPIPDAMRPRAFLKGDNGKLQDITKDILIANGSVGTVSYDIRDNEYGHFSSLKAVRVDSLVEYKKKGGASNDFSELGDVESLADDFSDIPERVQSDAQKALVEEPVKKTAKKVVELEDDELSDLPF